MHSHYASKNKISEREAKWTMQVTTAQEYNQNRKNTGSKGVKWNNVDCGTAGMKDHTKDAMGCLARP